MSSTTITIEIQRHTAITLLWIAAGTLAVGATFFAAFDARDHWALVHAAGLASALFLGALTGAYLRPPVTRRARWIGFAILAVFTVTMTYGWRSMEATSRWQRWLLLDIRSTIGRGVLQREVLATLEPLQEQDGRDDRSPLGGRFLRLHPGAVVGANIRQPQWTGDSVRIIVTELSDSAVTVAGIDAAHGWDADFRNVAGRTGLVQVRHRLTREGIVYAVDN